MHTCVRIFHETHWFSCLAHICTRGRTRVSAASLGSEFDRPHAQAKPLPNPSDPSKVPSKSTVVSACEEISRRRTISESDMEQADALMFDPSRVQNLSWRSVAPSKKTDRAAYTIGRLTIVFFSIVAEENRQEKSDAWAVYQGEELFVVFDAKDANPMCPSASDAHCRVLVDCASSTADAYFSGTRAPASLERSRPAPFCPRGFPATPPPSPVSSTTSSNALRSGSGGRRSRASTRRPTPEPFSVLARLPDALPDRQVRIDSAVLPAVREPWTGGSISSDDYIRLANIASVLIRFGERQVAGSAIRP